MPEQGRKDANMRRTGFILAVLLMGICCWAEAGELGLYVAEEAFQVDYSKDIRLMEMEESKLSAAFYFNEDRDIIINAGLMLPGLLKDRLPIPLSFSVGARAYISLLTEPTNKDVFVLAPGAGARFDIPVNFDMPMAVTADFFYGPSILTFGDADQLLDFTARFEVTVIPRATGFIGYRKLRFELDNIGNQDYEDSFHIGMRYRF